MCGIIENGRGRKISRLKDKIIELLNRAGLSRDDGLSLVFIIPEELSYAHSFELKDTIKGIKGKVEEELNTILPLPVKDLVYSYQVAANGSRRAEEATAYKIMAIASNRAVLSQWQELFHRLNIGVSAWELEIIAVYRGIYDSLPEQPVCLVDMKDDKTIVSIFPKEGENIDPDLQAEVITNMYKYRAAIPLIYGDSFDFSDEERTLMETTRSRNSICDIIMEGVDGQITEVVEHILHHVTDVGLHYTFPDMWGVSETSAVGKAVSEAVEKGYYNVESYREIKESDDAGEDVYNRVLIQEYAYWIIYDYWELREIFGPTDGDEFTILNGAQMKEQLPASYDLIVQTVPKVMVAPSPEMLREFFE